MNSTKYLWKEKEANGFRAGELHLSCEESEMKKKKKEVRLSIQEKWMETLAEVRVSGCGDELAEPYFHCAVCWYHLNPSLAA